MGNCLTQFTDKGVRRVVTLLALGLDNAGKTTTIQGVKGEISSEIPPTMGFELFELHAKNFDVKIFDLGGGARIRGIWQNYLAEAHGIIYVVDSADMDKMEECRVIFNETLSDDRIRGKPILILANKQDKPEAIDELELCTRMKLDEVVNRNECHSKVVLCSALPSHGRKTPKQSKADRGITNGYLWLLGMVERDYDSLQERIDKDVGEQKKQEAKERAERIERVRQRREERERQEKALEEQAAEDDRPRPEGVSCQELPNESPSIAQTSPSSRSTSHLQNDKNLPTKETLANAHSSMNPVTAKDTKSNEQSELHNVRSATATNNHILPESTLPGAIVTRSTSEMTSNDNGFGNDVDKQAEISEHPHALSTASLKELVRDTPTPTKLHGTDSTLTALPNELNHDIAKHDSMLSIPNNDDESGSVSSATMEKKHKKKRKHKKRNKIQPGQSEESESLQGKLAPIRNAPDSNVVYGKLPPIGASPNFSSDVEM